MAYKLQKASVVITSSEVNFGKLFGQLSLIGCSGKFSHGCLNQTGWCTVSPEDCAAIIRIVTHAVTEFDVAENSSDQASEEEPYEEFTEEAQRVQSRFVTHSK